MFKKIYKIFLHLAFFKSPQLVWRIFCGYFRAVILRQNVLRSVELAVTYQCQARCHKCYAKNLSNSSKPVLSIPQIKTIISEALELGIIHVNITGGEPTLRKDICDIIRACSPKKIMVSMVTNALCLTRDLVFEMRKAGLNTIQISLDSADAGTHDSLRGVSGCYEAAMRAAEWSQEAGITVCFSTVLSTECSSNKDEMYKLLRLAESKKIFLLICDSADVGGWEGQGEKMMTCEERDNALRELLRHPWARHHQIYNFRMREGCPAGTEKIYVTAYGDVTPCDLIHESYGNVFTDGLKKPWEKMCREEKFAMCSPHCIRYLIKENKIER